MNENQAKTLVSELFSKPFDLERYKHFLKNLLNSFETRDKHYSGNLIQEAFKQYVSQYWRIGKYVDPEGNEMDLLVVQVKSLGTLEHARASLRNFAVGRLKQFEKNSSLVVFYSAEDNGCDWRFSFVKIEHEAYLDKKDKVKFKQEFTPARRYSYLVGEHENSHTACRQLLPILLMDYADPKVRDIESAFSIEKVTDEFFDQYKTLFQKLVEHLEHEPYFLDSSKEESKVTISRFAKKLLGQIVFLYFLQKKGWMGVPKNGSWGEGARRFLFDRFEEVSKNGGNFFRDFLQYLFYEALASERREQEDPGYYERFDCRLPFLNGGLFEADYDWQNGIVNLPNNLFHNNEKTKVGDNGTGILDVFERYNFTIKEDEPLDKEVAVDPEMLGKVFENMLEVTERKSKGAFYTPREIVHYMCQESLINYLDNRMNTYSVPDESDFDSLQTGLFAGQSDREQKLKISGNHVIAVPREDIEKLIRKGLLALENDQQVMTSGLETNTYKYQLPESVRVHAKVIDEALADIRACDPAIGSGAFPVGLLHEIVNARTAIARYCGNTQSAYQLKRHTIAESLYGVDIDPSAIDIARLRLWLSLIVEENNYDNIDALPNLDYKIMQGDSLIGFPENWQSQASEKIETLKKEFFQETDHEKKTILKERIELEIKKRMDQSQKTLGWQVNFDFRVFFSEVWHEKGGFDVVIGNPPYVQIQNFSGQQIQKDWEKQQYQTFAKTGDIYCLFYEKGYRLLREQGVLAFITSNKWMRAAYGEKLRAFFLNKVAIYQLIDFGDSPIFSEATTYTNILLFGKKQPDQIDKAWDLSSAYSKATSLMVMLEHNQAGATIFNEKGFTIASPEMAKIKKQVEEMGIPLKDWDISINYGVKTGLNEAFIIDGIKKDELIEQDPKSAQIIKPILRGRDIKRYRVDFADQWLIATFPALNLKIDDYPAIHRYLESFGTRLHQTGETIGKDERGNVIKSRKKTGNEWFETQDQIGYYKEFEKEKVVYPEIVFDSAFFYDKSGAYPEATTFVLTGDRTKCLTALLNSQLLTFVFRIFYAGGDLRGDTFRYKKIFLQNLPVVKVEEPVKSILEIFVDYVQFAKRMDQKLHSVYFEQIIDGLVYELYFPDEIRTAGKNILPHLGELSPTNDSMSEAEKLAVIQSEFDRLYDPHHLVRNHLETLGSVEVVRIICEALKR